MKDDSLDDVQLSEEWYEVKPGVWLPRRAYWNDPVPSFDDEAGTYSDPKCCTCSPVYVAWPDDHEPLSGPVRRGEGARRRERDCRNKLPPR